MSSPSHSSPHLVTPQYNPLSSFGLCVILSLLTSSNAIVQNLSKDPVTHVYPYDPTVSQVVWYEFQVSQTHNSNPD